MPAPLQPRRGGPSHTLTAWVVRLLIAALAVAALVAARRLLITDNAHPRSRAQRVALVNTPRPPPPKEEKPKEIEVRKTEVEVNTQQVPPPGAREPDNQLGVDADGEGAGDGFGLVAKRGGQDIITLGEPGGGGASAPSTAQRFGFAAYGGLIRQRLQNELAGLRELRERDYVAVALIWIDSRGRIERTELPQPSGHAATDLLLRRAFAEMPVLPEPPSGLPQPLRLRITSKDLNAAGG